MGALTLLFTFPAPIIFAVLLNELRGKTYKKVVQTVSYIPHFISVVVICSMLNGFGSTSGLFNDIRELLGMARVDMNNGSKYFLLDVYKRQVCHCHGLAGGGMVPNPHPEGKRALRKEGGKGYSHRTEGAADL